MTFYYHFKDIYDLVEWSCLEDARRALDEKKTGDTWQQGLLQIFEAVQENKPFILNVYRCVHREQVEKYLQPLVDRLVLGVLDEEAGGARGGSAIYRAGLCLYPDRGAVRLDQGRHAGGSAADRGKTRPAAARLHGGGSGALWLLILSIAAV